MFGDRMWEDGRTEAQDARQQAWLERVRNPVVIEIGAGTAIPTVRHFSSRVLRQHGGSLARINVRERAVASGQGVGPAMAALDALQAIERAM